MAASYVQRLVRYDDHYFACRGLGQLPAALKDFSPGVIFSNNRIRDRL